MTWDVKVGDKEEEAEACVGHFLVCAEPGDPVVTPIPLVPKAPLGLAHGQGQAGSSVAHGHSRAMQGGKMTAIRAPQTCAGFQDADNLICDCEEFGSSWPYPWLRRN